MPNLSYVPSQGNTEQDVILEGERSALRGAEEFFTNLYYADCLSDYKGWSRVSDDPTAAEGYVAWLDSMNAEVNND